MKISPLLFLTGCINPNHMPFTLLADPKIRHEQYVKAIDFYLKRTNLPILFVENSGVDVSNEFSSYIDSNRVEILTFNGNDFDRSLGKGFGEMLIIEHAIKHSEFFKRADFIFKITGRYKVLNINSFIKQLAGRPQIQVLVDLRKFLSYSDSRFWGAERDFFFRLIESKDQVNDSANVFFEHVLCRLVHQRIIENCTYAFLKYMPRYSGIYGTTNTSYNDSWRYWFPENVKHRLRHYLMNY
ncbi:MAG: hypothetical protein JWQ66_2530 [Mucilaginibacter sp.]|nr:hypothetical protein [Mucilaginibacter sp.]